MFTNFHIILLHGKYFIISSTTCYQSWLPIRVPPIYQSSSIPHCHRVSLSPVTSSSPFCFGLPSAFFFLSDFATGVFSICFIFLHLTHNQPSINCYLYRHCHIWFFIQYLQVISASPNATNILDCG